MALEAADTSVRIDAAVLHKLMHLAGELLTARDQFRAVCERTLASGEPAVVASPAPAPRATLALFATPDEGRMAIPLSHVDRIEEFDAAAIFFEGPQRVVRYRGGVLPLVGVSGVLPERRGKPRHGVRAVPVAPQRRVQVVVHAASGRAIGLVVDRLLDVFEDQLVLEQPGSRPGARASVVLRGRVTELVDVEAMIANLDPRFAERAPSAAGGR